MAVEGFDKNEAIADFIAKMESCKEETESKDCKDLFVFLLF